MRTRTTPPDQFSPQARAIVRRPGDTAAVRRLRAAVSRTLLLVVAVLVVAVGAAEAHAEIRTGEASDPIESQPSLVDGSGSSLDIERVIVSYDTVSGTFSAIVRVNGPIHEYQKEWVTVSASSALPESANSEYCGSASNEQNISVTGYFASSGTSSISVDGFSGTMPASRTFSGDRREITISGGDGRFAGRDLRCFTASIGFLGSWKCMTSTCGSMTRSGIADSLDRVGFFHGFGLPECRNGVDDDGDGKTDDEDPGCNVNGGAAGERDPQPARSSVRSRAWQKSCRIHGTLDVRSPLKQHESFFAVRKVRVLVTGPGRYRRTMTKDQASFGEDEWNTARLKRPGIYTVTAQYLGDPYRTKSKTQRARVRVPNRCAR